MIRTAFVVLASLLSAVTIAGPAHASDEIGLSLDGVTFSSSLSEPLFDPDFRWVPGDEQTRTFYVRNQSRDGADLAVDVLGNKVDSLLGTGDLTIRARGNLGTWHDLDDPGTHRLVDSVGLEASDVARVDVAVSFAGGSSNQSQLRRLELDFRIGLGQDIAELDGGDGGGLLPATGGPALAVLVTGLALVGAGLTVASRRREKEEHHV